MLEKIIDCFRKPMIFKRAQKAGCDIDGDIVTYHGTRYYVNILADIVRRVNEDVATQNYKTCYGCPYYFEEADICMYGEEDVPDILGMKCKKGE